MTTRESLYALERSIALQEIRAAISIARAHLAPQSLLDALGDRLQYLQAGLDAYNAELAKGDES
jgi:hypothetical protein